MKFELEPDNRGHSDSVLLDDLRAVAIRLSTNAVSRDQYEKLGRFHPKTLVKRFGSWNRSLELAGLGINKPHLVSEAEFLDDLRRVASLIGGKSITVEQYADLGKFSTKPVPRLFGKWLDALKLAGLEPSPSYKRPLSEAELFENLEAVWRAVGRQPRQSDLREPLSRVGHEAYNRRFGSWRKALERFVEYMNEPPASAEVSVTHLLDQPQLSSLETAPATGSTRRIANWRLRFLVMRRDKFKCCQCGANPAQTPGTVLVIDHILPWSKGGQTTMDNLQTLCIICNGGKGDLEARAV